MVALHSTQHLMLLCLTGGKGPYHIVQLLTINKAANPTRRSLYFLLSIYNSIIYFH